MDSPKTRAVSYVRRIKMGLQLLLKLKVLEPKFVPTRAVVLFGML